MLPVPVEAPPFQTAAAALRGNSGKLFQQSLPAASAAVFRPDVQVFQINARPSEKRGKIMEEQGEADFPAVCKSKEDFRLLPVKNPLFQRPFIRNDFVQQLLILRKFPDELQNQGRILSFRKSETDVHDALPPCPYGALFRRNFTSGKTACPPEAPAPHAPSSRMSGRGPFVPLLNAQALILVPRLFLFFSPRPVFALHSEHFRSRPAAFLFRS